MFSLGMPYRNLSCVKNMFERHLLCVLLCLAKRFLSGRSTLCKSQRDFLQTALFLKPGSLLSYKSRVERPRRQKIETPSLCLLVLSARS